MNAAPVRLAITTVLAALLLSIHPAYGEPIVKFVSPVKHKPHGLREREPSSQLKRTPTDRTDSIPPARHKRGEATNRAAVNKQRMRSILIRKPTDSPDPTRQQKKAPVEAPAAVGQPAATPEHTDSRPEPRPNAKRVTRSQRSNANQTTESNSLSAFIKTDSATPEASKRIKPRKVEPGKRKIDKVKPELTADEPQRSSSPTNAQAEPSARVAEQPKAAIHPKRVTPQNALRSRSTESPAPLRQKTSTQSKSPEIPTPPHLDARSSSVKKTHAAIAKTRIKHVAAPSSVVGTQPPSEKTAQRSVVVPKEEPSTSAVKPASTVAAPRRSAVVRAFDTPDLNPESVNSKLVEKIVGRPSLITFVAGEQVTLSRSTGAANRPLGQPSEVENDEDGVTSIDRLTVNVRPTEGELPPDHASAKFEEKGRVVQRMGASRHWMMYEFNWEASALMSRPVYFEDVNLERYGYSHGLLLEPLFSAGHFFLRVPFIPYMRGANPPLKRIYALGYGRPGTYFPYYLHRPPFSLRGVVQEAACAVGLVYILP